MCALKQFLDNWLPPDYSAHGWQVDQIIVITHWLMAILFVFWSLFFIYTLYRFRASRNPRASYHGMQSHWSTWGEAGVAVVEIVLLVGFSIPAWYRWSTRPDRASANPFGLDMSDPAAKDDVAALNQLHLPVNRQALIHVTSKDVIHSFKLPVMRVEQDAIPGMDVPIHFMPIRTTTNKDRWEIACAQLCGLGHYRMRGQLFVDTPQDLQKWLAEQPK